MKLTQQELRTTHDVLDRKLEELQTSGRSDEPVIEEIEILINVMNEIQAEIGDKHHLKLTTDELEVLRGLIDELAERQGGWGEDETELNSIRYQIAVIREEPLYK